ncbi:MAG: lamin tail domain-containing protein [Candidatus Levybacteria bacterium]|nr:lamin tail domain-containing protein [Candidatus Levybacteria bacterium]
MKKLIFLNLITMTVLFGLSYSVTRALFADSATSTSNSFTAAAEFPSPTPTPSSSVGSVVINELMWSGSTNTDDEWLELRNMTSSPIDLTNWKLEGNTTLTIASGTIPANGYFLVSHFAETDENSILGITPDIVSPSVQLNNTNLQLTLRDASSNIVDQADDAINPPFAGSNTTPKKSMERNLVPGDGTVSSNWHTASTQLNLDSGALESATPKGANSL